MISPPNTYITKATFEKAIENRGLLSRSSKRLVLDGHTVRRAERGLFTRLFDNKLGNELRESNKLLGATFFQVLVDTYGLDRANECVDLLRPVLEHGNNLDSKTVQAAFSRLDFPENRGKQSAGIINVLSAPFRWVKDLKIRWVKLQESNYFTQHFLKQFDVRIRKVPGAGDCFFYAIAYQLRTAKSSVAWNPYTAMVSVRQKVADECMPQRAAEIREPATGRSLMGLISWGEAADAQQVAHAFNRPVVVVSENKLARGIFYPKVDMRPYDLSSAELHQVMSNKSVRPIVLVHNGTNHWDAIEWAE